MEWLDGPTLDALARSRPATAATLPDRLRLIEQAAEAVADLHSRTRTGGNPALHRDLKPANCMVDSGRGLVLVDVSTLRLSDDGVDPQGRHTPGYTAPEVMAQPARAREPQSDVYSLGALAVFCLTGEDPPPASVRVTARLARQVRAAARAAGVRDATAFTDRLTTAIAVDPELRPTDVRQWARTVAALGGERRPGARRPSRTAAVAGAAAAVFVVGAVDLTRDGDQAPARSPDPGIVVAQSAGSPTAEVPGRSGSPAPTTTVPPATPVTSAAKPTPYRPPRTTTAPRPAPTTAPAPVRPVGAIAAPAEDAATPECSYLSGTATLPPNTTLILANQNISGTDTTQYVEYVFGWRTPSTRWSWRGAQYFGSGDSSVGQSFRVRLLAVDLAEAHRLGAGPALAAEGVALDGIELHRVAGPGIDGDCPGP
jgi:serine/threonine-protein kinase